MNEENSWKATQLSRYGNSSHRAPLWAPWAPSPLGNTTSESQTEWMLWFAPRRLWLGRGVTGAISSPRPQALGATDTQIEAAERGRACIRCQVNSEWSNVIRFVSTKSTYLAFQLHSWATVQHSSTGFDVSGFCFTPICEVTQILYPWSGMARVESRIG